MHLRGIFSLEHRSIGLVMVGLPAMVGINLSLQCGFGRRELELIELALPDAKAKQQSSRRERERVVDGFSMAHRTKRCSVL